MDGLSLLPNPGGQDFSKCIGVPASDKVKEAIFLNMTISKSTVCFLSTHFEPLFTNEME